MKRSLALILSLCLILCLFAGCAQGGTTQPAGGSTAETAESQPTVGTQDTQQTTQQETQQNTQNTQQETQPAQQETEETTEPAQTEEPAIYHLAAGHYDTDADGIPLGPYEYEGPLTDAGDVLTFWTTTFVPQSVPMEGFNAMPNVIGEREKTGVNVEYIIVSSEMRYENIAVLLAADDLPDVLSQGLIFVGMQPRQTVLDGHFANLNDYREYMPNYMYYATHMDDNTRTTVFGDPGYIYAIYALFDKTYTTMSYVVREDWLNRFDLTHDDIRTIEDIHNMLTLFKTEVEGCTWPMEIISSVDVVNFFSCFDTITQVDSTSLPTPYVVEGEVRLPHAGPNDYDYVSLLSQWFAEGLIDANWGAYLYTAFFAGNVFGGQTGFTFMQPAEIEGYEMGATDPDARWEPVHYPVKEPGQTLHLAYSATNMGYGHACIAARCENIPLAVSWCDWRYSPSGSLFSSFGVEGLTWEYDANGEPRLTDFAVHNPDGITYANLSNFYMVNFLSEHGLEIFDRKYAYDGGERFLAMHSYWADSDNDDAYKWPGGVIFTDEQNEDLARLGDDIVTYLAENFLAFIDGSKSLTEWDGYVSTLESMGWEQVRQINQDAYDDFMAANG